jgi:hypothetical protein
MKLKFCLSGVTGSMADKDKKDVKVDGSLTNESVKVMAESIGIPNLPDTACDCLSADATYRLKQIVQVGR